jgi:hypothetical protein
MTGHQRAEAPQGGRAEDITKLHAAQIGAAAAWNRLGEECGSCADEHSTL